MKKKEKRPPAAVIAFYCALCIAISTVGCISSIEHEAFRDLMEVEHHYRDSSVNQDSAANLPELSAESKLEDYLAYAALNNPDLESAFNKWKAALEKVPQARSLPDPKLSYGYFIREVETKVGPQRDRVSLSQMFPWFGTLELKAKVALAAANAARQKYEEKKLSLFKSVSGAYYEYYYLAQAVNITEENVKLMQRLEGVVRAKYSAGKAPHSDLIKIQVALASMEDRLKSLNELRGPLSEKLKATLGIQSGADLPFPVSLPDYDFGLLDEKVLAAIEKGNPALKAIEYMAEKEKLSEELASKKRYPNFTLGASYVHTRHPHEGRPEDAGKDPIMLSATLNIPIWTKKYAAAEREAKARHQSALMRKKDMLNWLTADMKMSLYKYRDSDRKIVLYRGSLIPKSKQALEVTEKAFSAGKASYPDLIDAQKTLLEFQLSLERAKVDKLKALSEVETIAGGREILSEE
ncbi:MAG: TolC family protein [Planctomycetota bacterium]